ncbi:uncharacterized protein LOC125092636 [Lutra lutra]|uniref:uncharacterized protein LOC125092636 n=1 Tax=Lutra lutra TaxID=9657 RepID=UPI001FD5F40A|nr:uncharacterized protein LOC125092636 [Lutra lutra]XP_047572988.1 uncharacterized protein LOC125092636 [Lutra lutra]XP_047572989.1 uncharacterized protein LOC125092636 [Lutra lutra]
MLDYFYMALGQSELKHSFLKVLGLFFSYLAWALGISLASSRSWRVWEFNSNVVPIVFIGLWEVFYFQRFNISGSIVELPMRNRMNDSWVISDEIWYGQDLILLANFMKSVVLIFGSMALLVCWIHVPHPDFLRSCYNISAFFLVFSSSCTMITVSWNFAVDFYGQSTLEFPLSFPIGKAMLIRKHFSYVFPLGVTTATLSLLSAAMFFCETFSMKQWSQVKPMAVSKCPK